MWGRGIWAESQCLCLCFLIADAQRSAVVLGFTSPLGGVSGLKLEEPVGSAGSGSGWERVMGDGDLH